jgi:methylated-DNA-[protein]-cysteine S-methyltransferase
VRAIYTRYEVPGWGVGELWTSDVAVLDHELAFTVGVELGVARDESLDAALHAAPREGAKSPPTSTVPTTSAHVVNGSVRDLRRASGAEANVGSRTPLDPGALVRRFTAFLAGVPDGFDDVPLDLDWCTPFQRAVADALRAVHRGEVVSYAELAALAGYPGAQRAVGTFCARNRLALLIPCHRVVAADGIGGYGSAGASVKRRLLALEGVVL